MNASRLIKDAMKKERITYKELAASLNIGERTAYKYVKNPKIMRSETITQVAEVLSIRPLILITSILNS